MSIDNGLTMVILCLEEDTVSSSVWMLARKFNELDPFLKIVQTHVAGLHHFVGFLHDTLGHLFEFPGDKLF